MRVAHPLGIGPTVPHILEGAVVQHDAGRRCPRVRLHHPTCYWGDTRDTTLNWRLGLALQPQLFSGVAMDDDEEPRLRSSWAGDHTAMPESGRASLSSSCSGRLSTLFDREVSVEKDIAAPPLQSESEGVDGEHQMDARHTSIVSTVKSVCTRRMMAALALGQFLSLCITGTGVCSQYISSDYAVDVPTFQAFLNYALLALYTIPLVMSGEFRTSSMPWLRRRWFVYVLVGLVDVEANFLVVKAYQYTDITSVQLLDCWSIVVVVFLSWWFLQARFTKVQILVAVPMAVGGLIILVLSDAKYNQSSTESGSSTNAWVGDLITIAGATLYGISNVLQEALVTRRSRLEFLSMLGVCGTIICGGQAYVANSSRAVLEGKRVLDIDWSWDLALLFVGFGSFMFALYSLTPYMLILSSATVLNLSLLTSDFFSIVAGVVLFHYVLSSLYFVALVLILTGLVVFNVWDAAPPASASDDNEVTDVESAANGK